MNKKKILGLLLTVVIMVGLFAPPARAQNNAPACQLSGTFTATGRQGGPTNSTAANGYNNKSSGCVNWWLVLTSTGFSGTSIAIQSAPDSAGVAGSWVNWAGTVVSATGLSANPATATTQALINVTGYYPWVSVNAATLTGTGVVNWTLYGYKGGQVASASGSGSGDVTASGTLTANALIIGGGTTAVAALGSLGTTTTLLHGNAAGAPTFGAVNLAADVTGNLGVANLNGGSGADATKFWRGDATWAAAGGGGVTCAQYGIAFAAVADTLSCNAGFTFDPAVLADDGDGFFKLSKTLTGISGMATYATLTNTMFNSTSNSVHELDYGSISIALTSTNAEYVSGPSFTITANNTGAMSPALTIDGVTVQAVAAGDGGGDVTALTVNATGSMSGTVIGVKIGNVTGGSTNLALSSGTGGVKLGTLAGIGTRPVLVDANGNLSAP